MKNKKFFFLSEAANLIMFIVFLFSLSIIWDMANKKPVSILCGIGIVGVILFVYFLRACVNNIFLFFGLHVLGMAVCVFLPIDFFDKFFLLLILLIFTFLDIGFWTYSRGDTFSYIHVAFVIAPAIGFLLSDVYHFNIHRTMFFVLGIVYFLMFYLRLLFINVHLLSIEKRTNQKMPLNDMIKNDMKLAIPFIGVSILLMIIARFDFIDKIALFIYEKFCIALRFIIIKTIEIIGIIYDFLFRDSEDIVMGTPLIAEESLSAENKVFNVISGVILFIIIGFIVILITKWIINIIKTMVIKKEVMTQTLENEDMIEIRENIVKRKKEKKLKLSKIRKLYKKTVDKNIKDGYSLQKYHTVRERSEDIKNKMHNDISKLNEIYEKERYGQRTD